MAVLKVQTPTINNQQYKKKRVDYIQLTGYGALASGVLCATFAKKQKQHKLFAQLAGAFSVLHIGLLEYYKHMKKS